MIVSDLFDGVIDKLQGRTDIKSKIPAWARKAVNDLTQSYPFEELGVTGPTINFVSGQSEYLLKYFLLPNGPVFTRILSWFVYFDGTNPPINTSTGFNMKGRALTTVEPMSNVMGIPKYYAQIGGQLVIGYNPDQAYTTYMRYQYKHPWAVAGDLSQAQIFMPDDWQEILEYAVAIKACDLINMPELSMRYKQYLHGDPKEPGNLGIIEVRQSQQRRNLTNNERQLQPALRRYC